MSTPRWLRSKALFLAALDLPPGDRRAFIEQSCTDDPSLLESVLDLLAEHSDAATQQTAIPPLIFTEPVFHDGELIGGRFRIVRFLERGGMGEVYEAEDERLVRGRVALKTLRVELSTASDALERFRREIAIAQRVTHENLCRVHDLTEHRVSDPTMPGGERIVPCLTMELVRGESLGAYLRRNRPLAADRALAIAREIAAGVSVLHDRGIIHRDLKPSNIMLSPRRDGSLRVVLMDFGLAKTRETDVDLFESRVSLRAGSPVFMAPELFGVGEPSVASDIYSFGVVLDEMVTLSRMFNASSEQAMYFAKLHEQPVAPSQRAANLPPRWEQAILRCVDRDPSRRFASAAEVIAALDSEAETIDISAEPAAITNDSGQAPRLPRVPRRRMVMIAAGVPSVVFLGAAGNAFLGSSGATIEVFDFDSGPLAAEYDYLCKGTTNEVIRRLSEIEGVRVIPLHATRARLPARRSAHFTLDGLLQVHEGQMRLSITVQTEANGIAWAGSFDRGGFANPLDMQADIAIQTAAAVRRRIVPGAAGWINEVGQRFAGVLGAAPPAGSAPTTSNIAFDKYMRARYLMEEGSHGAVREAVEHLNLAVTQDPSFALAWAALADAYVLLSRNVPGNISSILEEARSFAEKSVRLDPGLAEAHASLATVRQATWDWSGAETSFREALRIRPRFARARRWYAGFILQFGRSEEAVAHARAALDLDPYDKLGVMSLGMYLLFAGQPAEAIKVLEPAVQKYQIPNLHRNLGESYARTGQLASGPSRGPWFEKALGQAAAVADFERTRESSLRPALSDRMFALFHSVAGDYSAAEPYARRLIQDMQNELLSPGDVAWFYAAQHNYSAALDLLERAAQHRDRSLLYIKVNPFLEGLRPEPRFQKLLRDLRL